MRYVLHFGRVYITFRSHWKRFYWLNEEGVLVVDAGFVTFEYTQPIQD